MTNLQKGKLIFRYVAIIHLLISVAVSICLYLNLKVPFVHADASLGVYRMFIGTEFITLQFSFFFFSIFYICLWVGVKNALDDVRKLFSLFIFFRLIFFPDVIENGLLWLMLIPETVYLCTITTVTVMLYCCKPLKEYLTDRETNRINRKNRHKMLWNLK